MPDLRDLKVELNTLGITHFIVRPDDGRVFPVFINLPIELRQQLNSSAQDKEIVLLALRKYWIIVKLQRVTVKVAGITQKFRAEVLADRRSFGGKIRSYPSTIDLLRHLEQYAGHKLPIRVRFFDFIDDEVIEVKTHLNSSAAFARIFIHTNYSYNRPIER